MASVLTINPSARWLSYTMWLAHIFAGRKVGSETGQLRLAPYLPLAYMRKIVSFCFYYYPPNIILKIYKNNQKIQNNGHWGLNRLRNHHSPVGP